MNKDLENKLYADSPFDLASPEDVGYRAGIHALFDLLKARKLKIQIDFTEEDLQRLQDGETFDWEYPDEESDLPVAVHLFNEAF